jgi:ABC-type Mn2+/Zn2+ transport system ATPase subunit
LLEEEETVTWWAFKNLLHMAACEELKCRRVQDFNDGQLHRVFFANTRFKAATPLLAAVGARTLHQ